MDQNRRTILKTGSAAGLAASIPGIIKAQNSPDQIKIGVIGCGGRGSGALGQAMSADPNVVLWAIGDAFEGGVKNALGVGGRFNERMQATKERQFIGLDAYKGVMSSGVDVVLLCTPPHFRPQHLRAAVEAGIHAFVEKPMAIDMPGIKSVIESAQMAKKKGTAIQHGYCWRYSPANRELFKQIHSGDLGRVVSIYGTYLASPVAPLSNATKKPEGMGDVEFQTRYWQNFEWLNGSPLVEQCIHIVDKVAWTMNDEAPIAAIANGGRAHREDQSNVFDHYDVTYEYAGGVYAHVKQRQMMNTHGENIHRVICENGTAVGPWNVFTLDKEGKKNWRFRKEKDQENNMYQVCHNEFFAALRAGKIVNTGEQMAKSTALGLLGREAAHTGKRITWEDYWKSEEDQAPDDIKFTDSFPVAPIPQPGRERKQTKPSRA
ncbi:MAG: Gfo/Idh/MocA family oxidoreductase [Akkermansiaceae bacterium]|nr:Gfo/Idh/MocA family oxidoreductase [Akkermansiaceae bacterium]MDB4784667.1 Gfo/Idh/MocA family oxidoreductase [Akkermansiaceae bacterium]MDC0324561.1 Gfo/Idh/MocA family oxidoreductase [Akkermansiaceae bacterium]RZN87534.1 MAG: Gfo/Idh/MocA family oxidoreductase [Verrucomicrobiaceae bacterium]HCQ80687.1 oxidoreductase [Verrucomicrobiales bacterium]